jgi:hypothetical protein
MNRSPALPHVIGAALTARLRGVRTCLPAEVVSYDAARTEISAQILINEGAPGEDGERVVERLPVINGVPVVFPGSGGIRIRFPINPGDPVLLVFCSSSIDRWLEQGGEVDPLDDRHHSINDAIAIPGLLPFPDSTDNFPVIEFTDEVIKAGGQEPLALKADVDALRTKLNSFIGKYNSHVHGGVTTGLGSSLVTATTETTQGAMTGTAILLGG